MGIELRPVCVCDECQHIWLQTDRVKNELPDFCPKCHTRKWNGDKKQKIKERAIQDRRDFISDEW